MNNADMPAMAIWNPDINLGDTAGRGLTKREQACLTMGVADTGDSELDAIITKSNKQKFAGLAMQGLLAHDGISTDNETWAVQFADSLLEELDKWV